jgi:hypothetical protein
MSEGSGEIIVKGGSVNLDYDDAIYVRDPNDPRKHQNSSRKITRVVVVDEEQVTKYDSDENPGGLRWTVTVYTK